MGLSDLSRQPHIHADARRDFPVSRRIDRRRPFGTRGGSNVTSKSGSVIVFGSQEITQSGRHQTDRREELRCTDYGARTPHFKPTGAMGQARALDLRRERGVRDFRDPWVYVARIHHHPCHSLTSAYGQISTPTQTFEDDAPFVFCQPGSGQLAVRTTVIGPGISLFLFDWSAN